jgi:hypothetical protein
MSVVSAKFIPNLTVTQTPASGFLNGQTLNIPETLSANFGNGSGTDQINYVACTTVSLAGSTTTVDLTSMTDIQGSAVNFAKVRFLIIKNNATTDGYTLLVGGNGSNPWAGFLTTTSKLTVFPGTTTNPNGGFVILSMPSATPAAVSGTSKLLLLDPGSNTFTVDIIACGA